MSTKQLISSKVLREVIIFSHLSDEAIELLYHEMELVELDNDEVLFQKGDQGDTMYIILEGEVKVYDDDYEFAHLTPYAFFGEYALLDDRDRSASVKSVTPSRLLMLHRNGFERAIRQSPQIKDDILKVLVLQMRQRNDWEEELAEKNRMILSQKAEIEKQRDQIKSQNDLKDQFFSIISHDLRGPVSAFRSLTDIMKMYIKKGRLEDLDGLMEEVGQATGSMSRLLDNLLNWARAEQDQMPYRPERLGVARLIDLLFADFASTARIKSIELLHDLDQGLEIYADEPTTMTLLRNLIHNGMKFTDEGGRIRVGSSVNPSGVEISISDSGVGMPADKCETLFDPAATKSTYGTSGEKGVGLGLQLVREFVALNKGQISVTSEPGVGTTFVVVLPAID